MRHDRLTSGYNEVEFQVEFPVIKIKRRIISV